MKSSLLRAFVCPSCGSHQQVIETRGPVTCGACKKEVRLTKLRKPIKKRRSGGPRKGPADVPPEMWRNPGYLEFLRSEGFCAVCAYTFCDPCHGPTNGTSSKGPDAEAIPMCRLHHSEQTASTWPQFEKRYKINRAAIARVWWNKFMESKGKAV